MPYVLAISVPALFVFDHLAEFLDVVPRRRILRCWMQGALLWPLVVIWGHPEETIALAFIVLSMLSAFSERWSRAGWYLGFAVAFQPYALLLLPMLLGLTPKGARWATIVRASLVIMRVTCLADPSGISCDSTCCFCSANVPPSEPCHPVAGPGASFRRKCVFRGSQPVLCVVLRPPRRLVDMEAPAGAARDHLASCPRPCSTMRGRTRDGSLLRLGLRCPFDHSFRWPEEPTVLDHIGSLSLCEPMGLPLYVGMVLLGSYRNSARNRCAHVEAILHNSDNTRRSQWSTVGRGNRVTTPRYHAIRSQAMANRRPLALRQRPTRV